MQLFVFTSYSYIDDTDLFQTGDSPIDILISIQEIIPSFGSLTEATGAALATKKSW